MEREPVEPIPACCGREMALLRSGTCANFATWIWRCSICERFESATRRYDGQTVWVGAMGRAVLAKLDELIAKRTETKTIRSRALATWLARVRAERVLSGRPTPFRSYAQDSSSTGTG